MTGWENQDLRALRLIGGGLGSFQVLKIEENRMTEQAPEQDQDWQGAPDDEPGPYGRGATYPQFPENPHNHRFTISVDGRGPMIVVRGNTAQEVREGFEELTTGGAAAAAQNAFQAFKGAPAAQAAPQGPVAVPTGVNYNPQMPPPNQPFPGQPAWQQAGAPQAQAPQWGGQPQQGGFGGGAPQGNRQGPKPRPDWPMVYKINVPYQGKEAFKAFREQNKDALKGKVAWAGGGDYWIHGDVVAGFGQYNPMAA